ncbi:MAG: hypothetical protein GXP03_03765 [Alphaproteobacteria bacterium]|nr:hypothetical protein [Alphaproteobacteria bacterium]
MLAHYLENAGIATVVISLVRLHSEKIKPPRALFVPFELGRPLGNPGDIAGQMDVLHAALAMLDHTGPEPLLADYPDPAPVKSGDWKPAFDVPGAAELSGAALRAECAAMLPPYHAQARKTGRSTFGLSGLTPEEVIALVADQLDGAGSRISSKLIRFAVDDLKSLYLESACLDQPPLSSAALSGWFWRQTLAAQAIAKFRTDFATSDDKSRQMIASFMVPGEWVDDLAL